MTEKVKKFEECNGFEMLNTNATEVINYMDTSAIFQNERDSIFWSNFNLHLHFISTMYEIRNDLKEK